jgi:hypothetical protein
MTAAEETTGSKADLLPLAVLAARIPGRGKGGRLTPETLGDWVRQGVVLPGGGRVKLRAIRLGGCWLSSAAWLAEFAEASTAAFAGGHPAGQGEGEK